MASKNPLELRSKLWKSAALGSSVTDQPDGARDREEPVYVQVTVLSKKVGTHHGSSEDGTIILSPFSESLVSYPPIWLASYRFRFRFITV